MERTQISLEPAQAERLRQLARERGMSMAHLIREAVDRVYGTPGSGSVGALWERARRAVGIGHGRGENIAEEHDRYLDEIYRS